MTVACYFLHWLAKFNGMHIIPILLPRKHRRHSGGPDFMGEELPLPGMPQSLCSLMCATLQLHSAGFSILCASRFGGIASAAVAGATGGCGKAIVDRLVAEGIPVRALVRDFTKAVRFQVQELKRELLLQCAKGCAQLVCNMHGAYIWLLRLSTCSCRRA